MVQRVTLENYFVKFRQNIVGADQSFLSPLGEQKLLYADWTASGRAYKPIENFMQQSIMPYIGNTHTGATLTGRLMSKAYAEAKHIVKQHVNAGDNDALVFCGSGMTAAVNKLQRILGMRMMENVSEENKPVVFITHMEHHSNQLSWLETSATVEIMSSSEDGNVNLQCLDALLEKYRYRKNKIAAITACSNVTGIQTPYYEIAKRMHEHGGLCFVDFACSAPYVHINMHPAMHGAHLDAIYFSPHKFLGGPGTPGVLVFNKAMYTSTVPDQPGGGTVQYSNPWKAREYITGIECREDGGTPPFLQAVKAAMCIKLKEDMGVENMLAREKELLTIIFNRFARIKHITVLAGGVTNRLGVVSFIIAGAHHNLVVKLLNDRFGIQLRGGCSCASTYGHILLNIDEETSYKIWAGVQAGDLSCKPGWVRLSLHPTMTDNEAHYIMDAIEATACNIEEWGGAYTYHPSMDEYVYNGFKETDDERVAGWFNKNNWG